MKKFFLLMFVSVFFVGSAYAKPADNIRDLPIIPGKVSVCTYLEKGKDHMVLNYDYSIHNPRQKAFFDAFFQEVHAALINDGWQESCTWNNDELDYELTLSYEEDEKIIGAFICNTNNKGVGYCEGGISRQDRAKKVISDLQKLQTEHPSDRLTKK